MSTSAIISIKPVYANQILAGTKTIELRKSAMGLTENDVILVYSSAPEQRFSFWFRIGRVESLPVRKMWDLNEKQLGIGFEDYSLYFSGLEFAVGFHIAQLQPI